MKRKNFTQRLAIDTFILITLGLLFLQIDFSDLPPSSGANAEEYFEGTVTEVQFERDAADQYAQILTLNLENGPRSGESATLTNNISSYANEKEFIVGDRLILAEYKDHQGGFQLYIIDHVRYPWLLVLFGFFIVIVLIVNRTKGAYALLSMAFSFLVLFKLVLPLLLIGFNPLVSALLGATLILPATFYLSHGFNKKTTIAIVGTLISLFITGILAVVFSELTSLSGLASEEAGFLKTGSGVNIDFRGMLLAGIIISVLGVLDDVSITQASVVEQLKTVHKSIPLKELFARSMAVGRDHIASVVNTLILVYTGASLPLLLLFINTNESIMSVLNLEFMAEEIVQTLIGSIGLVFAVPITTLIATYIFHYES